MPLLRSARTLPSVMLLAGMAGVAAASSCSPKCGADQYCRASSQRCHPCAEVCDPADNNYNLHTCTANCTGYLHGLITAGYQDQSTTNAATNAAIRRLEGELHQLTMVVIAMFCLFVVCFLGGALYECLKHKRCRRRKKADLEGGSGMELKKIGAKLANGSSVAPAVISPKASTVPQYTIGRQCPQFAVTTVSPAEEASKAPRSRHPSEDTLPEDTTYSPIYDNPALSVTPPLAASGATRQPLAIIRSRDSPRRNGSSGGSSARTEVTRLPREDTLRFPRQLDVTDLSPRLTAIPTT